MSLPSALLLRRVRDVLRQYQLRWVKAECPDFYECNSRFRLWTFHLWNTDYPIYLKHGKWKVWKLINKDLCLININDHAIVFFSWLRSLCVHAKWIRVNPFISTKQSEPSLKRNALSLLPQQQRLVWWRCGGGLTTVLKIVFRFCLVKSISISLSKSSISYFISIYYINVHTKRSFILNEINWFCKSWKKYKRKSKNMLP